MSKNKFSDAVIEFVGLMSTVVEKVGTGEIKLTTEQETEYDRLNNECIEILELSEGATSAKRAELEDQCAELFKRHSLLMRQILASE